MSEFGEGIEGVLGVVDLFRSEHGSRSPSERQRRARVMGDRIVTALRLYVPVAILMAVLFQVIALGPGFEEHVAPVRDHQSIHDVVRTGQDLCWAWESDKVRPLVSENLDLFVDVIGEAGAVGAPWEKDTRMPWVRSRAVGLGHHVQSYCVTLPPYVRPITPVKVRQVAWYPGFLGLWKLPLHMPDVVDPAGSVIP